MVVSINLVELLQSKEAILLGVGFLAGYFYLLKLRTTYDKKIEEFHQFDLLVFSGLYFIGFLYMSLLFTLPFWTYTDFLSGGILENWIMGELVLVLSFIALDIQHPLNTVLGSPKNKTLPVNYVTGIQAEMVAAGLIGAGFTLLITISQLVGYASLGVVDLGIFPAFVPNWAKFWFISSATSYAAILMWDGIAGLTKFGFNVQETM